MPIDTHVPWVVDDDGEITGYRTDVANGEREVAGPFARNLWNDLRMPASGINPAGAQAPASVIDDPATFPGALSFSGSQANNVAGLAQLPHGWDVGSAIKPHIHWCKSTGSADAVTWNFYYRLLGNPGDVAGDWVGPTVGTIVAGSQLVTNQMLITSFGSIDMTGYHESAMVNWRIERAGNTDADNNAVVLFEFDIHYQASAAGSVAEIPTG